MLSEDEKSAYQYEIHVREKEVVVVYFANAIDLTRSPFLSFQPKYVTGIHGRGEVHGEILTFPSHLVEKIIHHVK